MNNPAFLRVLLSFALALGLLAGSAPAPASAGTPAKSVFYVNLDYDQADPDTNDGLCDVDKATPGSQCTFRAAIEQTNAQAAGAPHTITFSGDLDFNLNDDLPAVTRDWTVIKGAGHRVKLTMPTSKDKAFYQGLNIAANNCTVQGLIISGFPINLSLGGNDNTIGVDGNGADDAQEGNTLVNASQYGVYVSGDNNVLAGNKIGTNGTTAQPNQVGVTILGANTRIGTDGISSLGDTYEGNIISGNSNEGIRIGTDGDATIIAGNIIGLNPAGTSPIPNGGNGINANGNALNLRIGTDGNGVSDAAEGNTISGNLANGIAIYGGSGHVIAGNRIGVSKAGAALATNNQQTGIYLYAEAGDNIRIGTNGDNQSDDLERNIISGHLYQGLIASNNHLTIAGNYIGTDASGSAAVPNAWGGLYLDGGTDLVIGMNSDGSPGEANEGNLVSGNGGYGIHFFHAVQPRAAGNRVGVNAAGNAALANTSNGIRVENTTGALIGTNLDGTNDDIEGNLLSGNASYGLYLASDETQDTLVYGNVIGLGSDKATVIPNDDHGIAVDQATGTRIGGSAAAQANLIGGNTGNGIALFNSAPDTQIFNNWIGVTPDGDPAGNGQNGIYIDAISANSADSALVDSNQIQYNAGAGIALEFWAGNGHTFISNSFRQNGGLAIDILPAGVNLNDDLDGDSNANGGQNFPLVTSASFPAVNQIHVSGTLHSAPLATYTIHLYAAREADPSGYGEGLVHFATLQKTSGADGNASFNYNSNWTYGRRYLYFSAIAIAADGSTSEFGPTLEVRTFFLPMVSK